VGASASTPVPATPVRAPEPAAAAASIPPIRRPPTVAGPTWDGTTSADAPWGAWVEVPVAGTGAIQLTWGEGPQPVLRLADAEGNWSTPDTQPGPPLHTAWLDLPAGWTWIGVEAPYTEGQPIRVAVWLPAGEQPAAAG
jgi:hypothetical protein